MDFDRPNAEIGQKMANGRLLFLALHIPKLANISGTHLFLSGNYSLVKRLIYLVITCHVHIYKVSILQKIL